MFRKLVAAILSIFRVNSNGSERAAPALSNGPHDMESLKVHLCGLAERVALECFRIRLDYSADSIKSVEKILASFHEDYVKTKSDEGMNGIAVEFAAYIVAVIERHFGPAVWERDDATFGPGSFPLRWRGSTVFPYSWCQKRIYDGPSDDVWFKFQSIILKHKGN